MKRKASVNRFTSDLLEKVSKKPAGSASRISGGEIDYKPVDCVSESGFSLGPKPVFTGSHFHFSDYEDFTPNLSPKDILKRGSFGGGYFRQITSKITNLSYNRAWEEFPRVWWEDLPPSYYRSTVYQKEINYFIKMTKEKKFK